MVLLGRTGVVNHAAAVDSGIVIVRAVCGCCTIAGAVIVGMTYVLLPYMVLTLYSDDAAASIMRLAAGGGGDGRERRCAMFFRVFLPLTLHGVAAGALLVFILAIGFFITPALMGAPEDLMVGHADRAADRACG